MKHRGDTRQESEGVLIPPIAKLQPSAVGVRVKIAGLWTSMLFVFVYVDLFGTWRPDFRAELETGEINGLTVDQTFLVATTAYVLIPSLMVFLALVLPPRLNRIVNIVLSGLYGATIIAGAIGEWHYYVLGSAIEVALLAALAYYAWTWPREAANASPPALGVQQGEERGSAQKPRTTSAV